jgi:hypothetical protein
MRSKATLVLTLAILFSSACFAQQWEIGALGGYGWYNDATISNPFGSADVTIASKGAVGAVFGQNMYKHIGGEVRWLLIFGGPELKANGITLSRPGFSNLVHYDLLVHITSDEARFRPFIAGGAGVRVFSVSSRRDFFPPPPGSPLAGFAILKPEDQAKPLISAGAGLKCRITHGLQLRFDFRAYMTPVPDDVFRRVGRSDFHGWLTNFVPTLGVSYLF